MQKSSAKQKVEFFEYKGLPLVRKGDTIYYGNMEDDYVVMMTILKKKKFADLNVASKVRVQLLSTDPNADATELVLRTSEQDGLYNALDIGHIWLERQLAD